MKTKLKTIAKKGLSFCIAFAMIWPQSSLALLAHPSPVRHEQDFEEMEDESTQLSAFEDLTPMEETASVEDHEEVPVDVNVNPTITIGHDLYFSQVIQGELGSTTRTNKNIWNTLKIENNIPGINKKALTLKNGGTDDGKVLPIYDTHVRKGLPVNNTGSNPPIPTQGVILDKSNHLASELVVKNLFLDETVPYLEKPQMSYMNRLYNATQENRNYMLREVWIKEDGLQDDAAQIGGKVANNGYGRYEVPAVYAQGASEPITLPGYQYTINATGFSDFDVTNSQNVISAWKKNPSQPLDVGKLSSYEHPVVQRDPSRVVFTNNPDYQYKNGRTGNVEVLKRDSSNNPLPTYFEEKNSRTLVIPVRHNMEIRFIFEPTHGEQNEAANFFDYDISDGKVTSDGKVRTMKTADQKKGTALGINSPENYPKNGPKNRLAFGNSNTGTGLGDLKYQLFDSKQTTNDTPNEFNHNNGESADGGRGTTFGLVKDSLAPDGSLQWNVSAPDLFTPGALQPDTNQELKGKTDYTNGEYSLNFIRSGGTYVLDKVTSQYAQPAYIKGTQDTAGIPEGHHVVAAGLSTFNNPSKDPKSPSSTVYHHIFTNNFWPMDTASSYGTKDHDIKFGSFAQKDNRKYSGIGRDISSLNTLPLSDDGLDHNSYFGMHYSVDFVVDPGYAGDLLYYFYGDDDLFVYLTRLPDEKPSYEAVDPAGQPEMASMLETSALSTQAENSLHTLDPGQSKLIADVGGVHSSVGMYVNLRDYISPIPYKDARGNDNSAQRYRLDFFYTERGASGSTCYMRFTVPFESLEANQMKYNGQVNVEKEVKNKSLETLTDPASAETKEQFVFQIDLKSPYGEDYHPLGVDDFTSCLSLTNRYPYKKYQRQKDGSSKLIESSTTWQDSDGTTHQGTGQYIMDGTQFVLEDQQYLVIEGLPGETVKISGGEQSEEDEEKEPVAPSPKQPGSATSISTHDGPPEMTRTYYRVHELGSLSAEKAADVQKNGSVGTFIPDAEQRQITTFASGVATADASTLKTDFKPGKVITNQTGAFNYVKFINPENPGVLTLTKAIPGNYNISLDTAESFTFKVTLTDPSSLRAITSVPVFRNGEEEVLTSKGSTYSVTLHRLPDQSGYDTVVFYNLPLGTTYSITENPSLQFKNRQILAVAQDGSALTGKNKPYINPANPGDDGTANIQGVVDIPESTTIEQAEQPGVKVTFVNEYKEFHPSLNVTKWQTLNAADPDSFTQQPLAVKANEILTYKLVVENTGDLAMNNVRVTDPVPAGLIYQQGSAALEGTPVSEEAYDDASGILSWTIGTLNPGEQKTVTFDVQVPAVQQVTTWTNKGTVEASDPTKKDHPAVSMDSNPVVSYEIPGQTPDLVLTKEQKKNEDAFTTQMLDVSAGDTITYKLILTNPGIVPVETITLNDLIPEGLGYVEGTADKNGQYASDTNTLTWTLGPLNPGQSEAVTFVVNVPDVEKVTTWTNSGEATWTDLQGDKKNVPSNPVISYEVPEKTPDLTITKEQKKNEESFTRQLREVNEGDTITYQLTVQNLEDAPAKNVTVTDTVPEGLAYVPDSAEPNGSYETSTRTLTWELGDFNPNETRTVSFEVTVPDVVKSTIWTNIGYVSCDDPSTKERSNPVPSNPVVSHENPDRPSSLSLHKTQKRNEDSDFTEDMLQVNANDTITYSLQAVVSGESPVHDVVVTDVIPKGLTYVENSVGENGSYDDQTKTLSWNLGTMNPGETRDVNFQVTVPSVEQAAVWTNSGEVTGKDPSGDPKGPISSNPVVCYEVPNETPDLTILKSQKRNAEEEFTASLLTVEENDTITYRLSIQNPGAAPVNNAVVTDTIPEGLIYVDNSASDQGSYDATAKTLSWNFGNLGAGETRNVTFEVKVPKVTTRTIWTNMGYVQGEDPKTGTKKDPVPSNPVVSTEDPDEPAVLSLIKKQKRNEDSDFTEDMLQVNANDTITYSLQVTVSGESPVHDVVVTDVIPKGLTYVENSVGENGSYDDQTKTLSWSLGTMNPGSTREVTFQIKVPGVEQTTVWTNIGTVQGDDPSGDPKDPIPSNPVVCYEVPNETPNLVMIKSQKRNTEEEFTTSLLPVEENDTITYQLSIQNPGAAPVNNAVVTDEIPEGLTYVDNSASNQGSYDSAKKTLSWNLGNLAAGEQKTVTFKVTVPDVMKTTTWTNMACVQGEDPDTGEKKDPVPSNPVISSENPQDPGTLTIVKFQKRNDELFTKDQLEVNTDDVITYQLHITASGEEPIRQVSVQDGIPEGLRYVESSASDEGLYDEKTRTLIWTLGDMNPGDENVVTFQVRVPKVESLQTWTNIGSVSSIDPKTEKPGTAVPSNPVVSYEVPAVPRFPDLPDPQKPDTTYGVKIQKAQKRNEENFTDQVVQVKGNDVLTYRLTVTPTGDGDVEDVVVTDTIPEGLVYVENSASSSGVFDNGVLTWKLGTLKNGKSQEVTFQVRVPDMDTWTSWINTAYETHQDPDTQKPTEPTPSNPVTVFTVPDDWIPSVSTGRSSNGTMTQLTIPNPVGTLQSGSGNSTTTRSTATPSYTAPVATGSVSGAAGWTAAVAGSAILGFLVIRKRKDDRNHSEQDEESEQ